MKWPTASLGVVAPPARSTRQFGPDDEVWQLNLDQIESHTGRILSKQRASASLAGNSTFVFDEANVLYSKLRPYLNKVVHPDEPGIATTELVPLRPRPGLLRAGFLKFYLRSDRFLAFANLTVAKAKLSRMIMDKFWDHEIPLPAIREQERVENILEQADTLRQKRTEADTLADRILPALFHKLFGDPASNPKNLPLVPLGELATRVTKGESPGWQGFQYQDTGPLFVTSENVRWGTIDLSEPKHIPVEFHQKLERSALKPHDILINLVGASTGRSCIVPPDLGEANVNQAVAVVTCDSRLLPDYLASLLLTPAAQARLQGGKVGAARANLSLIDVRHLPVLLPNIGDQQRFVAMRNQATSIFENRAAAKENISKLFATMLHRAFAGDLTAKWREAHLKELLAEMQQQAKALNLPANGKN